MSFTEGFTAIESIKNSSLKLSDTLGRVEALEIKLERLLQAQAQLEGLIDRIAAALGSVERSSTDLSERYSTFTQQASSLPDQFASTIERAEERFAEHYARMTTILDGLPNFLDQAIEQKLQTQISDLEARISDRLRDELKDTRQTLRDAMEVKLDNATREIIAEMPRTFLGRRGK